MSVPGSNLLKQAMKAIKPTTVQYLRFNGRQQNAARQYINSYDPAAPLTASVQAIRREKYQELGLDLQKNYIKIWASASLIDLSRDYSGDKFIYGGKTYQLADQTDWLLQDGWCSALAVQIKGA